MIKTSILGAVAFTAITSAAFAADLPTMKGPPPFVAPPVFTWTGFYFGGNVGYGWASANNTQVPGPDALSFGANPFRINNQPSGVLGGGQIGYNWQTGAFVLGVEADLDASGISGSRTLSGLPEFDRDYPADLVLQGARGCRSHRDRSRANRLRRLRSNVDLRNRRSRLWRG